VGEFQLFGNHDRRDFQSARAQLVQDGLAITPLHLELGQEDIWFESLRCLQRLPGIDGFDLEAPPMSLSARASFRVWRDRPGRRVYAVDGSYPENSRISQTFG
jgi:hypothetical protein